jgi:hypothetical protein
MLPSHESCWPVQMVKKESFQFVLLGSVSVCVTLFSPVELVERKKLAAQDVQAARVDP